MGCNSFWRLGVLYLDITVALFLMNGLPELLTALTGFYLTGLT
jgi:hypothetical protein